MSTPTSLTVEQLEQLANRVAQIVVHQLQAGFVQSNDDRLLSRAEMAKKLGIGLAKLDQMTQRGEIPSMVIGDRRVFCFQEVRDVLSKSQKRVVSSH